VPGRPNALSASSRQSAKPNPRPHLDADAALGHSVLDFVGHAADQRHARPQAGRVVTQASGGDRASPAAMGAAGFVPARHPYWRAWSTSSREARRAGEHGGGDACEDGDEREAGEQVDRHAQRDVVGRQRPRGERREQHAERQPERGAD